MKLSFIIKALIVSLRQDKNMTQLTKKTATGKRVFILLKINKSFTLALRENQGEKQKEGLFLNRLRVV